MAKRKKEILEFDNQLLINVFSHLDGGSINNDILLIDIMEGGDFYQYTKSFFEFYDEEQEIDQKDISKFKYLMIERYNKEIKGLNIKENPKFSDYTEDSKLYNEMISNFISFSDREERWVQFNQFIVMNLLQLYIRLHEYELMSVYVVNRFREHIEKEEPYIEKPKDGADKFDFSQFDTLKQKSIMESTSISFKLSASIEISKIELKRLKEKDQVKLKDALIELNEKVKDKFLFKKSKYPLMLCDDIGLLLELFLKLNPEKPIRLYIDNPDLINFLEISSYLFKGDFKKYIVKNNLIQTKGGTSLSDVNYRASSTRLKKDIKLREASDELFIDFKAIIRAIS